MISVLLPTRGRPEALRDSIESLLSNADDPSRIEILLAIDEDDAATEDVAKTLPPQCSTWMAPERYGYARLHEYINFLASEATGDWLMLWNDDALMLTQGWDTVVAEQEGDACLFMDAAYPVVEYRGNIFPIWPQAWYHVTGFLSRSPNCDVWMSEIAERLARHRRIPVQAVHNRASLITEPDATHLEGRAVMGEGNDGDYDSAVNRMERSQCVRMIGWLYEHAST